MPNKELKLEEKLEEISKDIVQLEGKANKITITDNKGVTEATTLLTIVKGRTKKIEELRKFFVQPLNNQVREINAMFKEKIIPYEKIEVIQR